MDYDLCKQFSELRKYYPDELGTSSEHDFHKNGNIKEYCPNGVTGNKCETEPDKIKAGSLWLFEQLFVENNKNINTVQYIIIWLSYKLNQKTYNEIKDLNDFYTKCIENNTHYTNCKQGGQDCSKKLNGNIGYKNYKEIINRRKNLLNINIENMSKFYDAFKPLCNMYTELNENNTISDKSIENANKFVEKYNELNVSDIDKDSPYHQVLSTLLSDYNNLKDYCDSNSIDCSSISFLTQTKTEGNGMQISEEICYVTLSSLSIVKKLILALLIFSAISIFLGIFFKCSLFVLRKRAQKQYLREKLKK
ncbi:PIR protein [Plasmodium yoelii]|uniref:PIR protein n=2 Tax=Plasmodium yoelii TaxID=5861 RepID=A0AAE9WSH9_PLAYO|nr:PIR protein [Plasmodium yoelii]WBY57699.1 PIR protein [Plasmodium yoelii yoelii]VTZ78716.1 PIR protein [Plasmodium yoelii]|eukprot:XP_034493500.1 PIR protein [Plasmodium yoelii]